MRKYLFDKTYNALSFAQPRYNMVFVLFFSRPDVIEYADFAHSSRPHRGCCGHNIDINRDRQQQWRHQFTEVRFHQNMYKAHILQNILIFFKHDIRI